MMSSSRSSSTEETVSRFPSSSPIFSFFAATFALARPAASFLFGAHYADSGGLLAILSLAYYVHAALGPNGANENGALSDLIDTGAANLDGNGEALNRTITGFSQAVLRDLHARLERLEVDRSPCTRGPLPRKAVHWAKPELVAQVAFTEWTRDGQLRHPRYLGLREDKPAADVVRER